MRKSTSNRVEQIIFEKNVNISNMYNEERKIAFINEYYQYSKAGEILIALQRFNQYGKREQCKEKDLLVFTRSDFFSFFESFPWGYSSFNINKGLVKAYLEWGRDKHLTEGKVSLILADINYEDPSHKKMYESYYFRSLSELRNTVQEVEKNIKLDSKLLTFIIAEVAIYFAWIGVRIQDLCTLKRNQVDETSKLVFVNGEEIPLESDVLNAIVEYKYDKRFVNSDLLMRTAETGSMSAVYLSNIISKFFGNNNNNDNDNDDRLITYNKVYWSGIYSRTIAKFGYKDLYDLNLSIEKLSDVFREDYTKLKNPQPAISKRNKEYQEYLINLFGSEYLKNN